MHPSHQKEIGFTFDGLGGGVVNIKHWPAEGDVSAYMAYFSNRDRLFQIDRER